MRANVTALLAKARKLARKLPPRCPPLIFVGADKRVVMLAHPEAPRGLRGEAAEEWIQAWEARCARP
ncbi:MAG TPA: hypothetical protein DCY80_03240 [Solibacterales bacterium]|nr:hypothetical protein [Bryobacterales bacterium]